MEDIEESIENKTIERDTTEVKSDDKPPVKIKKPRSEAQKKAFEKARATRAVNFKKRQEERANKDTQIKEVPPAPVTELKPVLQRRPPSPRYREQQPTTVTHNYYYNESPKPKKNKKKIQVQSSDEESDEDEIQVVYQQESVVREPSPTPPTRPTNPLKFKYT